MENTNGEVILAYNPETLDASKEYPWFNSLMGIYGKEDKVNGTSAADSMPQQTIKFRLPDGYKGYVRVFYEMVYISFHCRPIKFREGTKKWW